MKERSIFEDYYTPVPFYDRYAHDSKGAVTVIIPTVHTNDLWGANLYSIYREIPVEKLLLGDGGCADDTISVAKQFPRVVVHDHRHFNSLGYSVRKLIEAVETDWFVYLHSDVYLPKGWFDDMAGHQRDYDWFGCRMRQTIMLEYDNDYGERPYFGSQMGRKQAFTSGLTRIDDDFVYRQEDYIFADLVTKAGYKEGKIDQVFHYHQMMRKPSALWNPRNTRVTVSESLNDKEQIRVWNTQGRGIIKYLSPASNQISRNAGYYIFKLIEAKYVAAADIYSWIREVNPVWLPIVKKEVRRLWAIEILRSIANRGKAALLALLR